ncbi:hypothetical protein ACFSCX_00360 [Bacillus salitolerans]|uniref:Uncharacterized protein n=1 Tax=Bacillus salitolerans TaxID=1437434 RepID=A0ABW4LIQ1_9BACI
MMNENEYKTQYNLIIDILAEMISNYLTNSKDKDKNKLVEVGKDEYFVTKK